MLDLQMTDEGGIIAVGETRSFGDGETNLWAMRQDSDGNVIWSRSYGDGNIDLTGHPETTRNEAMNSRHIDVAPTADGGCLLAGARLRGSDENGDIYDVAAAKLGPRGNVEWRRTYPGGELGGRALDIERTSDGGFVLAGYVESQAESRFLRDRGILVIKLDAGGVEEWRYVNDELLHQVATSIQEDADGNLWVGSIRQYAEEDPDRYFATVFRLDPRTRQGTGFRNYFEAEGAFIFSLRRAVDNRSFALAGMVKGSVRDDYATQDNSLNVWTASLDSGNGDERWNRSIESNGDFTSAGDAAFAIEAVDGGWMLVGYAGILSRDGILIRLDRDGDTADARTFGGEHRDEFHAIRRTSDFGYVIAGMRGVSTRQGQQGFTKQVAWLIKLNGDLSVAWERTYDIDGTVGLSSRAYAVEEADGRDGYLISGAGDSGGWVIRTDGEGEQLWKRWLRDLTAEGGRSVRQTDDDGDGGRDDGFIIAGYTETRSYRGRDAWLVKIDGNGDLEWQRAFGSTEADDEAFGVAVGAEGEFAVAGTVHSSVPVEDGVAESDAWVFAVDAGGSTLWERVYRNLDADDAARSIEAAAEGGYFVAGDLLSTRGVGSSAFVMKLDSAGQPDAAWGDPRWFDARRARSVHPTRDGGCAVAGHRFHGEEDAFWIARLDGAGATLAERSFGGRDEARGTHESRAASVIETEDGFALAGTTRFFGGGFTCEPEDGLEAQCANFWVLRLDADLRIQWERTYSTSGEDRA
ncbi:MAG: hypothetical protein L0227_14270, partial [Chloroflexi bacterium]|nr:hypothetical protein [Chloroflexota bacterium]